MRRLALFLTLPIIPVFLSGQDAEEIIELSPFQVDASEDQGYYSAQTLAGGRLKSELKDVATSVQVITSEMLEDIGATSLDEVLAYTTNTDAVGAISGYVGAVDGDGTGTLDQSAARQDPSSGTRVRGMAAPTRTTDYFETGIPFHSYNSSRIDINRGANSFLFGLGSPGGIVNNGLSKAEFRDTYKFGVRVSTEVFDGNYSTEFSIDVNKEIIEDRLAVRFAAMEENEEFMQKPAYTDSSRQYFAVRLKPFADHRININANYETGKITAVPVDRLGPLETLSTFLNDPYGTVWGSVGSVNNAAGRRISDGFGNIRLNNKGGNVGYLGRDANGGVVSVANYDKFLKRNGWMAVYDGTEDANGFPTRAVHTGWTNGRIARGSPTFDPDKNLTGNNQAVLNRNLYMSEIALADFDGFSRQGLLNYDVFDFSRNLLSGTIDNYKNDFDRAIVSVEAISKSGNFGIDLSYAQEEFMRDSYVAVAAPEIDIDINYSFPIGPNALFGDTNPNFGRLYFYAPSSAQTLNTDERETLRATAFAKLDMAEKFDGGLLSWLGRHTITGLYDDSTLDQKSFRNNPLVFGNDAGFHLAENRANIFQRQWSGIFYISDAFPQAFENPNFQLTDFQTGGLGRNITVDFPAGLQIPLAYLSEGNAATDNAWNQPRGDETAGVGTYTPAFSPFSGVLTQTTTESQALNLQSFFLKNHFVANLGWRSDEVTLARNGTPPLDADNLPIRSSDVFNLDNTVARVEKANTFAYGLVLKAPEKLLPDSMSLSFHYGDSENFIPNPGGFDLDGNSVPSASGSTKEVGITIGLMNDKLVARINKYKGTIENESFAGTNRAITLISNAHIARGYNGLYLDMDQYDRNRDGKFDFVQDPNDSTGTVFIDPDLNKNLILDRLEAGGADYVAGAKYMPLDQFISLFNAFDAFYTPWARETAEFIGIPGTVSGSNDNAVAQSGSGLSETLTDTVDLVAEGYEFELTYNPSKNLRLMLNVTQQSAKRSNISPRLEKIINDLVAIQESVPDGPFLVGSQQATNRLSNPLATTPYEANTMAGSWLRNPGQAGIFFVQKALEGSDNPEVREYRVNALGNYTFTDGRLKGFNVGGAYRWQDSAAIGYKTAYDPGTGVPIKDVVQPYFDDGSEFIDMWIGYRRKIFNDKVDWRVQLNIRNLFADKDPVVVQVQPNGAPSRVSFGVPRQFVLSNTFSF